MKIGIVVGRFQVSDLTDGHKSLLKHSLINFDKVIVFIGETKNSERTEHDPLPYDARASMVKDFIYDEKLEDKLLNILIIRDVGNYPIWVSNLDNIIENIILKSFNINDIEIYIVGSRDSVAEKYKSNGGKYNIHIYNNNGSSKNDSGTKSRLETVSNYRVNWTKELRKFLIWWYGKNA